MTNHPTTTERPTADISQRKVALIAGFGLLFMALLAPFALFGVLQTLVAPTARRQRSRTSLPPKGSFVSVLRPS